ncbi:hypothetical protein J6590_091003 [Homalodisca vitripennis]|nr:hypothetical protein J6590_091003 [Homalodisca vitripennis]
MNKNKKSPTSTKVRDGQRRPGYPLSQRAIRIQGTAKDCIIDREKQMKKDRDNKKKTNNKSTNEDGEERRKDEMIKKTKKEDDRRLRRKTKFTICLNIEFSTLVCRKAGTGFKSCVGQKKKCPEPVSPTGHWVALVREEHRSQGFVESLTSTLKKPQSPLRRITSVNFAPRMSPNCVFLWKSDDCNVYTTPLHH